MRILHLCLSNFYIDGYSYQENELVRQNVLDGHDVEVIASTETINDQGEVCYVQPARYMGGDGAMVERVEYSSWLPHAVMRKLRIHPGIYARIARFRPDTILFHSACGWEIVTAARYVRNHPEVPLYIDSHEDFVNSARTFASKYLLHFAYYRTIVRACMHRVRKFLPVNVGALEFLRDFYGVPEDKLEFYPLGALISDDDDYTARRHEGRSKLGVDADAVVIVQSGKQDRSKLLVEALQAFSAVANLRAVFVIAGLIKPDIAEQVSHLMAMDPRIRFDGWKTPDELRTLLCAADVYCQPGTQSATMQMSLACRCAVILDDVKSHQPYYADNGWLTVSGAGLGDAFAAIADRPANLTALGAQSYQVALRLLDYRLLAARISH